jgi:hypothetical protein
LFITQRSKLQSYTIYTKALKGIYECAYKY